MDKNPKVGDIYIDNRNRLWRVVEVVGEPQVIVQEIEPAVRDSPVTIRGGVTDLVWKGFVCLYHFIN